MRKTVRFAAAGDGCGTFSVRRPQIPILHPRAGKWTLQVDSRSASRRAEERVRADPDHRAPHHRRLMSARGVRLRAMAVARPVLLGLAGTLAATRRPVDRLRRRRRGGSKCARSGTPSFNMITSGWAPGASLTIHLGSFGRTVAADGSGVSRPPARR